LTEILMPAPKVLLVDDEPQITHLVARKFQLAGIQTIIGQDGEEGLQLALEHDVDLIVSDLQMPYMSGIEMALALRQEPSMKRVPIIILTARGYVLDRAEIEEAGISRVIPKPFSANELLECVNTLLGDRSGSEIRDAA
jgi:DNA-binding response OmpR family regulator